MRPPWDEYFLSLAREVATRSTCSRRHVGAVVVRDKVLLSTGYNGSIRGLPHCEDVGCQMENGHCVRTVHAEANAIVQAARNGVSLNGAHIYITDSPCLPCFKLILNAGVREVVYDSFYKDDRVLTLASMAGITLRSGNEESRDRY